MVSVAIPYLGDWEMLERCLESLRSQTIGPIEITVADNGTADAKLDEASDRFDVNLIRNSSNRGFSIAVNQSFEVARGEYFLVQNGDATLDEAYLETCVNALEIDPRAGGVTGKVLKIYDPKLIDTTGHVIYGDRRVADRGEFESDEGQFEREGEVFSISATAALYRASALRSIRDVAGELFDEDFFAYGEDLDVSWRLRLEGWTLRYAPGAIAYHRRDVSRVRTPTKVVVWNWRNYQLCVLKNDSLRPFLLHSWEVFFTELRLTLYYLSTRPTAPFRKWFGLLRLLPRLLAKRRKIQSSRKVSWGELEPWFRRYDYLAFLERLSQTARS